ncbi:Patatin [Gloeothece citriformis PCC 7424]|uniref:Patatin n=1 Tax=Gloeothece citriformis (strain PCC 7424) TaxID=65393 RepID=B7KKK2_GLOC7|nr:patatin-like protein [Gloeothece citriformis]ACK72335.1 Patatin [Gloeothece citriformis PCC 7424]
MTSTATTPLKKPSFCREIRLGLVVYGGVSLAIYMNGVCREFYNAIRGRGIYKLIKALTDSDIVVDIVSGTSAGGINGILLSYAIANSDQQNLADFKNFGQIWRDNGDIDQLLREPSPNKPKNNIDSVLDGEGYYQDQLKNALDKSVTQINPNPDDEWYSDFKELDLFVTGTDVLGKVSKTFDQTGKEIEIKDHRTVFHLRYRQDRIEQIGNPFSQTSINHKALAKLCRITSCFPVAFPVVTVKLDPIPGDPDSEVDQKLVKWGQLNNRELPNRDLTVNKTHQLYFIDGGVLDNRPFSYTINEIFCRTAYRPVTRKLFYIDPAPDSFLNTPQFRNMAKPNIGKVITDSLINLPRYESIGTDLARIQELNQKVTYYRMLRETLENETFDSHFNTSENSNNKELYLRCRLIALRDRVINRISNTKQVFVLSQNKKKVSELETAIKLITQFPSVNKNFDHQDEDLKLEEISKKTQDFDVQFFFRKSYFLNSKIGSVIELFQPKLQENQDFVFYWKLQRLVYIISWHAELLKLIQVTINLTMENILKANFEGELKKFWYQEILEKESGENTYLFLLAIQKTLLVDKIHQSWENWKQAIQEIPKNKPEYLLYTNNEENSKFFVRQIDQITTEMTKKDEENELLIMQEIEYLRKEGYSYSKTEESLLIKVDHFLQELLKESKSESKNQNEIDIFNDLINTFENFEYIDARLYPCEFLSEIQTKSTIALERISPNDAQFGLGKGKTQNDKLAGDQFRAFGGFFKKSWRSNDILWGRLDGLNRLVESLVDQNFVSRFQNVVTREIDGQDHCNTAEAYISQLVDDCIKYPEINQKVKECLIEVFNTGKIENDEKFNDLLNNIVLAGQREIVETDLPVVVQDAIEQQLKWNQESKANAQKESNSSPEFFDQTVNQFAAVELANLAEHSLKANTTPPDLVEYFKTSYQVGSETLQEDIPSAVRSRWINTSVLNLRDMLVTWKGEKILKSPVFFILVTLFKIIYGDLGKLLKLNGFLKFILPVIFVGLGVFCFIQLIKIAPLFTLLLVVSLLISLVLIVLGLVSNLISR